MARPDLEEDRVGQMARWRGGGGTSHRTICCLPGTSRSKDRASLTPMLCSQATTPIPSLYSKLEETTSQPVILFEEVSTVFWKR